MPTPAPASPLIPRPSTTGGMSPVFEAMATGEARWMTTRSRQWHAVDTPYLDSAQLRVNAASLKKCLSLLRQDVHNGELAMHRRPQVFDEAEAPGAGDLPAEYQTARLSTPTQRFAELDGVRYQWGNVDRNHHLSTTLADLAAAAPPPRRTAPADGAAAAASTPPLLSPAPSPPSSPLGFSPPASPGAQRRRSTSSPPGTPGEEYFAAKRSLAAQRSARSEARSLGLHASRRPASPVREAAPLTLYERKKKLRELVKPPPPARKLVPREGRGVGPWWAGGNPPDLGPGTYDEAPVGIAPPRPRSAAAAPFDTSGKRCAEFQFLGDTGSGRGASAVPREHFAPKWTLNADSEMRPTPAALSRTLTQSYSAFSLLSAEPTLCKKSPSSSYWNSPGFTISETSRFRGARQRRHQPRARQVRDYTDGVLEHAAMIERKIKAAERTGKARFR